MNERDTCSDQTSLDMEDLIETVMFELHTTRREAMLWIERNDADMGYGGEI
jgi:hypothetical protein|tara:strand:- start:9 stop:161 length:153 start_codon:yes stop_codon:yes gene_type:complete